MAAAVALVLRLPGDLARCRIDDPPGLSRIDNCPALMSSLCGGGGRQKQDKS